MGGLFQGITNVFGGLLGETDAQFQQKQANKISDQAQQKANQYSGQAGNAYSNLVNQGQGQSNAYHNNYLSLLSQFGGLAGLGNVLNSGSPTGANVGIAQNGLPVRPGAPGTAGVPATSGVPQGPGGNNPYTLDANQEQKLNQSLAGIAHAQQAAVASFKSEMAANGITDPRALHAGEQQLGEHFSALSAQTQTQFYEQIKTDKLKALEEIIAGISQYGTQGIQEQEAGASGLAGLAGVQQNTSLNGLSQAATASQTNQDNLGGLLNLVGFGFGGGFGGAGKVPKSPSVTPVNPSGSTNPDIDTSPFTGG